MIVSTFWTFFWGRNILSSDESNMLLFTLLAFRGRDLNWENFIRNVIFHIKLCISKVSFSLIKRFQVGIDLFYSTLRVLETLMQSR